MVGDRKAKARVRVMAFHFARAVVARSTLIVVFVDAAAEVAVDERRRRGPHTRRLTSAHLRAFACWHPCRDGNRHDERHS